MYVMFPKLGGEDVLPEDAINRLPFSAEPLLQWGEKSDLLEFLNMLVKSYNSEPQDDYFDGKREFEMWATKFARAALEEKSLSRVDKRTVVVPDFLGDPFFGKVAKYAIAWEQCVAAVLGEDAFYSLAHVLESEEEIKCSILLSSQLYYKQALQVLRSFVEDLVLPIYFCDNPQKFSLWKLDSYRTPKLRGKGGILEILADDRKIISGAIKDTASDLYGELNGTIHGSEKWLIHAGAHTSSSRGFVFKYDVFCEWGEYLCRTVDLGIRLLKVSYIQTEGLLSPKRHDLALRGKVLCGGCHNEDDFDEEAILPKDNVILVRSTSDNFVELDDSHPGFRCFHCHKCGSKTIIDLSDLKYVSVVTTSENKIIIRSTQKETN